MKTLLLVVAVFALVCAIQARSLKDKRSVTREEARANYDKVVQELNNRFANYLENCFPRPKGCLCVTGTDKNGREITERRKNDNDCKSKPATTQNPRKRKGGN